MEIKVHDNQVDKALKTLKMKMAKDGLLKDFKRHTYYEKPSVKKKRKQAEARKKKAKAMRKR
ncbi:MAG: 30S ribosomal protein S21 [Nitrospirae bacterium]|nr:30S ribosomal protein S21 [Nitrospirota bacterium]